MLFTRLKKLGRHKWQKIVNELARGAQAQALARIIQQKWGDAQDISEETLARQLTRLHAAISNGACGEDMAQHAKDAENVRMAPLHRSTFPFLNLLTELIAIQWNRVSVLLEREERLPNPPLRGLNQAMRALCRMIVKGQEMRFDLGVDEYNRGFWLEPASAVVQRLPMEVLLIYIADAYPEYDFHLRPASDSTEEYAAVFQKTASGWSAYIPDLAGCVAAGSTRQETRRLIHGAIELHLRSLKEAGKPIPEPTSIAEHVPKLFSEGNLHW